MMITKKGNDYTFMANKVNYEVEVLDNGSIEIYETDDPGSTGFVLDNTKHFNMFINMLTDIAKDLESDKYES